MNGQPNGGPPTTEQPPRLTECHESAVAHLSVSNACNSSGTNGFPNVSQKVAGSALGSLEEIDEVYTTEKGRLICIQQPAGHVGPQSAPNVIHSAIMA